MRLHIQFYFRSGLLRQRAARAQGNMPYANVAKHPTNTDACCDNYAYIPIIIMMQRAKYNAGSKPPRTYSALTE